MIVGNPFWRYPIAVATPEPSVAPLMAAIRELDVRPFRIVSHVDENGCVFNASFFEDETTMRTWLRWLDQNALQPNSKFHGCLVDAVAAGSALPTSADLLFGVASQVLDDTRFGEYQLGMAVRYSTMTFRNAEIAAEAREVACSPDFEVRLAHALLEAGVSYFGRVVMQTDELTWLSAARFGSVEQAHLATRASQSLLEGEMDRWFTEYKSIYGEASRVMDLK